MTQNPVTQSLDEELTIEDIYDLFMAEIEPELMLSMIPEIDELYRDETEEERKERAKRYEKALEEFEKRFAKACALWKEEMQEIKEQALSLSKEKTRKEEEESLSEIESKLDDISS